MPSSESTAREGDSLLGPEDPVSDEDSVHPSSSSLRGPSKWAIPLPGSRSSLLLLRIAAAMFSFVVLGMMVSTLGVMVPQFESYYGLTDFHVSFVFLVWPVGYLVAAYLNDVIHVRFGQRGIAAIGPLFHLIFTVAAAFRPPFPVLLVALAIGSLGTGILDGSFCAWAGGMENANIVQGFLHGSYSAGAALGPFLAGTMLSVGSMPWYAWYYVLLGASVLEAMILLFAFRFEDSSKYQNDHQQALLPQTRGETGTNTKTAFFKYNVTWICAAYFLAYIGTENGISGWIVVFMQRVNHASDYLASLSSSGFWIGQAAGRLLLGVVTDRVGVRVATIAYLVAALIFELLFAAVHIPAISAVMIALLGFCIGPLFPAGVVMMTRHLPRELHVGAISFVVLIGQVGGALLPFALGALADTLGIQVFQIVVFAQLAVTLLIWFTFPKLSQNTSRRERLE
ncbi:MFS general substrate transporter [Daldinia caldariorum]|uniref:MFS general substrate transporter n=1 Tax=Daldinia caldariorum TaxID=326644 RepID=UPI002008D80A|nr:MFS general substrate transporter [Daldinia caldariorum]KAI1466707.1 MFS general substrate transporter [Daldinia caldariorum]